MRIIRCTCLWSIAPPAPPILVVEDEECPAMVTHLSTKPRESETS